ncbi:MAG: bifunctional riboflavin kinase/FAD synthetase [Flavobacterium sp.]
MKIFNSIQDFSSNSPTVLTLGTFDGVHKGHKSIIGRLTAIAQTAGATSTVLTFFPHPRMVLQQDGDIKLLNTINEKAFLLEQCGVDNLIIHPFDHAFSRLTAEEFVKDILVDKLKISHIIIGHDHRFGRNRTATITDLEKFGTQYGFEVIQISALEIDEVSVSSTKIRNALDAGDITTANSYLGYPYLLTGTVVKGREIGRTIGFPTANVYIAEDYKLIPPIGIYVVSSIIDGKNVFGMMSIGTNPTVGGTTRTIEINYLDFNGDLYGKELHISVYGKIRDEQKFPSLDALKEQLVKDGQATRTFFQNLV